MTLWRMVLPLRSLGWLPFFFANFHFDISSHSCSGFSSGRGRYTSQCCGWRPGSLRTSVHRSFLLRGEKICLFNNDLRVIVLLHFHREESVRKFSAVLFTILSDASACQIRGRLVAFWSVVPLYLSIDRKFTFAIYNILFLVSVLDRVYRLMHSRFLFRI